MLSTLDHCMDLVRSQFLEHTGSDGSQFWDRISRRGKYNGGGAQNCDHVMWYSDINYAQETVIRYIVDQGVPSRGHRTNIFNPQYYYVGACLLKAPKTGYKGTVNFSFTDITLENTQFSSRNFNYKRSSKYKPQNNQQKPTKPNLSNNNPEQNYTDQKPIRPPSQNKINHNLNPNLNPQKPTKFQLIYQNQSSSDSSPKINMNLYSPGKSELIQLQNLEDQQFNQIWNQMNSNSNTINLNSNKYLLASNNDIFSDNLSTNFRPGKQVVSTKTKTKISTTNGIKRTQITKTVTYSDGSTETVTKIV